MNERIRDENRQCGLTEKFLMESRISELEEENACRKRIQALNDEAASGFFLGFMIGAVAMGLVMVVVAL